MSNSAVMNYFGKLLFINLIGLFLLFSSGLMAQPLLVVPEQPTMNDLVVIRFDASQGNAALKDFDGTVYFHTGLITNASRDEKDWKFVVGDWGKDDQRVVMKSVGNNIYEASFTPARFYNVADDVKGQMMAFVFRNTDGSKVAKTSANSDFYINFKGYKPVEKKEAVYLFKELIYSGFKQHESHLTIETSQGEIVFRPFTDSIVEVSWHPDGFIDFFPSHAVVAKPQKVVASVTETPAMLVFDMAGMQVLIRKKPFNISYLSNGKAFLAEEKGFFSRSDGQGLRFRLDETEKLYGSGGRASGLNLRGQKMGLYNRPDYNYEFGAVNLNYTIPTLLSSNNYFLFVDNPHKGWFDLDSKGDGVLEYGAGGGSMRYFLITGKNAASLLRQYSALTGKQSMLPRWAYGNLQSRMAYRNQAETEEIVNRMIAEDFPIDAIILDFYWFGDSILGHLGRLDWWKPSWPDPKAMISGFSHKGVHTITISEPYIIDSLQNWKTADSLGILVTDSLGKSFVDKQFYFGPGSLIDIFKPEAGDWLWKQYRKQFDIGISGLWGDLGEPESHPAEIRHIAGKADEVHNIYGHYWAKTIYDNFRNDFPEKRLFFLARSGYAGTQRFGIVPWSGDISRSWAGFKAQLPAMLNMSLSGIPYMHSDAGGFATGVKDDELYTRWLQFAVFTPVLRPHGSGIPSEPIFFNDTTKRIVRHFMKLRYELLPYIYTTAWQTQQTGTPIARPMLWHYPDDSRFQEMFSQYFFGNELLVAPVLEPAQQTMDVELPNGTWYHFWTGNRYLGGKKLQLQLAPESIPVFVKGGSIIPRIKPVNQTKFYSSRVLFLHVYLPGADGKFSGQLFEDDGETADAYAKGNYELLQFDGSFSNGLLEFAFSKTGNGYAGMPESRLVEMIIYGYPRKMKAANYNSTDLPVLNSEDQHGNKPGFWQDLSGNLHLRFVWYGENNAVSVN